MRKKLLSLLVAVCLIIPCMFMLTACGKTNTAAGTYSISAISMGDITWTAAQYAEKKDAVDLTEDEEDFKMYAQFMFESETTFELKDDNTFSTTSTFMGESETQTGTWTQDGNKVTLTFDLEEGETEADVQEATYSNGTLTLSNDMGDDFVMTVVLSKN